MSDDADLQRIRAARLQQLASQSRSPNTPSFGSGGGGGGDDDDEDEQRKAESNARATLLLTILTPPAADRLGRIKLVNAQRARAIENRLMMAARSGQLRGRATEEDLVRMLEAMRDGERERGEREGGGRVVFERRKGGWEEEEEDF